MTTALMPHSSGPSGGGGWELKTRQQRRVALDAETAEILREHVERARSRAASLGLDLPASAFLFSGSPDSSTFPIPDSVTQRYDHVAARLEIATTFDRFRHYSAAPRASYAGL